MQPRIFRTETRLTRALCRVAWRRLLNPAGLIIMVCVCARARAWVVRRGGGGGEGGV